MGAVAPFAAPLVAGGLSFLSSRQQAKGARAAAAQADPFAPYRSAYGDLLSKLYGFPTTGAGQPSATTKQSGAGQYIPGTLQQIPEGKRIVGMSGGIGGTPIYENIATPTQASTTGAPAGNSGIFAEDFIMNLPGLKSAISAANKATRRAASAGGFGRSGNVLSEISKQTAGIVQGRAGEELDRIARLAGAGAVGGGAGYTAQATEARAQPLSDIGSLIGRYAPAIGGGGGASSVTPTGGSYSPVSLFGNPQLSV